MRILVLTLTMSVLSLGAFAAGKKDTGSSSHGGGAVAPSPEGEVLGEEFHLTDCHISILEAQTSIEENPEPEFVYKLLLQRKDKFSDSLIEKIAGAFATKDFKVSYELLKKVVEIIKKSSLSIPQKRQLLLEGTHKEYLNCPVFIAFSTYNPSSNPTREQIRTNLQVALGVKKLFEIEDSFKLVFVETLLKDNQELLQKFFTIFTETGKEICTDILTKKLDDGLTIFHNVIKQAILGGESSCFLVTFLLQTFKSFGCNLRLLLHKEAPFFFDPKTQMHICVSPLIFAILFDRFDVAELLINFGAPLLKETSIPEDNMPKFYGKHTVETKTAYSFILLQAESLETKQSESLETFQALLKIAEETLRKPRPLDNFFIPNHPLGQKKNYFWDPKSGLKAFFTKVRKKDPDTLKELGTVGRIEDSQLAIVALLRQVNVFDLSVLHQLCILSKSLRDEPWELKKTRGKGGKNLTFKEIKEEIYQTVFFLLEQFDGKEELKSNVINKKSQHTLKTPLINAILSCNYKLVKLLVENGATVDELDLDTAINLKYKKPGNKRYLTREDETDFQGGKEKIIELLKRAREGKPLEAATEEIEETGEDTTDEDKKAEGGGAKKKKKKKKKKKEPKLGLPQGPSGSPAELEGRDIISDLKSIFYKRKTRASFIREKLLLLRTAKENPDLEALILECEKECDKILIKQEVFDKKIHILQTKIDEGTADLETAREHLLLADDVFLLSEEIDKSSVKKAAREIQLAAQKQMGILLREEITILESISIDEREERFSKIHELFNSLDFLSAGSWEGYWKLKKKSEERRKETQIDHIELIEESYNSFNYEETKRYIDEFNRKFEEPSEGLRRRLEKIKLDLESGLSETEADFFRLLEIYVKVFNTTPENVVLKIKAITFFCIKRNLNFFFLKEHPDLEAHSFDLDCFLWKEGMSQEEMEEVSVVVSKFMTIVRDEDKSMPYPRKIARKIISYSSNGLDITIQKEKPKSFIARQTFNSLTPCLEAEVKTIHEGIFSFPDGSTWEEAAQFLICHNIFNEESFLREEKIGKILELLAKRAHKILSSPLGGPKDIPFITKQMNFCLNCCIGKTGFYQVTSECKYGFLSRKIANLNEVREEATARGEEKIVERLSGIMFLLQTLNGESYLDLCDVGC
jgi:hypothetical protein